MDPSPSEEKTVDPSPKEDPGSRPRPGNKRNSSGQLKPFTLNDCMTVMSSWNDSSPPDSDTDSDASDMSFTDDELRGTSSTVLPNTNMSNSGKDGKPGSSSSGDISASLKAVSGSGSDFFNTPVSTTASDSFNPADRRSRFSLNDSSEEAIQKKSSGNVSKRSSILTRIKRGLKKNPKFVNANAKLIEMTPGKLQFRQNDKNTYDSVEVTIRNISDSIVAYKLKRSDNIFEVSRRMGILNPQELHTFIVSVKPSGKVNNNRIITRVAVLQEGQLTEPSQQVKFWKQLPAREIRQLVKQKCMTLAPGDALHDGTSDLSDADTMSMMTMGSCISSNTSMLSTSDIHSLGTSPQVSPSPSGKKPVDVPQKDVLELPRHEAQATIKKSLEEIKTEIFGKQSDTPVKPTQKTSKVFEKKKQEQAKQASKADDPKSDAAPEAKYTTAPDMGDKPDEKTTETKKATGDDTIPGNTVTDKPEQEKEPHLTYETDTPKTEMPSETKDAGMASKPNELPQNESAVKSLSKDESPKPLPQDGGSAKEQVADGEGAKSQVTTKESAKDLPSDGSAVKCPEPPKEPAKQVEPSKNEPQTIASSLPSAQPGPFAPSEEPREGSMGSKELPQQAQTSAFHPTEFEGPATEIPGLEDSQAYKKQAQSRAPRKYQKQPNDNKEMKYESEPKLSMRENYADLHKLKQSFSESPMADYSYGAPLESKPTANQRGFTQPEPYQTDESELEYADSNISNKPSIHIYRSAWSHSPTIPNQKFIKKEVSSSNLTREYQHGIESGPEGSSPPKLHRHAPFYDFVMSHSRRSPGSDHWHSPRVNTPQMYCPGHQYKVNTSPMTIHEGSNSSLENGHSVEINEGDPQTITVTTHISTSSLHDARSSSRMDSPRKKTSDCFGCSDDADSEEVDVEQWKLSRFRRNKQKIANLTQNVISGLVFLFMWSMLLIASMLNSYGSGLCWEAPPEPEPYSYEWLTDYLFEPPREV